MKKYIGIMGVAVLLSAGMSYGADSPTTPQPRSNENAPAGAKEGDQQRQQAMQGQQARDQQKQCQEKAPAPVAQHGQGDHSSPPQQTTATQPSGRTSSAPAQLLKGEFVSMEGDFYIIKDANGKVTCIPTNYGTFIDETFVPGDTIEARMGDNGATKIRRVLAAGSEMTAGAANNSGRDSSGQNQSTQNQSGLSSGSTQQGATANSGLDLSGQGQSTQNQSGLSSGSLQQGATANSGRDSSGQNQSTQNQSGLSSGSMKQGADATSEQRQEKGLTANQPNLPLVKGELLNIQGEMYTVKDSTGNEVRLHVNKETKMDGALQVGDKIEAERTASGHATSIKKSSGAGTTSGSGQEQLPNKPAAH